MLILGGAIAASPRAGGGRFEALVLMPFRSTSTATATSPNRSIRWTASCRRSGRASP